MLVDFIIASIAFVVISTFIYCFYNHKLKGGNSKKKRKKDAKEIMEIRYLVLTYKLKKEKLLTRKIILLISLIDAFIITGTFLIIILIPYPIIWQLMIGFVLLLGLIYAIYNIFGRILVKKGYDKE